MWEIEAQESLFRFYNFLFISYTSLTLDTKLYKGWPNISVHSPTTDNGIELRADAENCFQIIRKKLLFRSYGKIANSVSTNVFI